MLPGTLLSVPVRTIPTNHIWRLAMSSEFSSSPPNPEQLRQNLQPLGEGIIKDGVVVGSSALNAALPELGRHPQDIDLTISEDAYRHLRQQSGWEEVEGPSGPRILKDQFDVGIGWGDATAEELKERSWQTPEGVRIAGLADVYTWKQSRGMEKDERDTAAIRERLQDPAQGPLPSHLTEHEREAIREALPEHLRDSPDAQQMIELAANGLAITSILYGDRRIGKVNQIIGDIEKPNYNVAATYHNGFDTVEDVALLQQHLDNIGASDEEHLLGAAGETYSDASYGNGRLAHNPKAHDELRAGNLGAAHAEAFGIDPPKIQRLRNAILGTTFTEGSGTQQGSNDPDRLVRSVAGIDLQILSGSKAVIAAHDIDLEDNMSARFSPNRTIGKVLAEHGVRINTTEQGLAFIDAHPDARPADAPDGQTVLQAFAYRMIDNADFHDPEIGYKSPIGWTLERPEIRRENANKLRELGYKLLAGEILAQESYALAHQHAEEIRERYKIN